MVRLTQRYGRSDSVVGRAVDILSAFSPSDGDLSLAELARRTGLAKATVHRLVHQLAVSEVVEVSAQGVRLGMRLFELGQLSLRPRMLRDAATPYLAGLASAANATVHFAVADGQDVLYVDKLDHRRTPTIGSRVGGRMPAHCTAVGKAMLAHASPAQVHAVLGQRLARRTTRTIIAPGLLERELRKVRAVGVAEEHEESTVGIACVAAPVLDRGGSAVAAVSITGRALEIRPERLADVVRAAARGISQALPETDCTNAAAPSPARDQ